ncbi:MAG: hypothetical protein K0Q96_1357, partial [Rubrobacteraceae bacterium]|nr:hypothetical protein [Rubrobacteraceae bacterium]
PLVTASRTAAIFTAVGSYPKGKEITVATFTSAPRNSLAARGTYEGGMHTAAKW